MDNTEKEQGKEKASFKNGDCNYVVDRLLNPRLFQFLIKQALKAKL